MKRTIIGMLLLLTAGLVFAVTPYGEPNIGNSFEVVFDLDQQVQLDGDVLVVQLVADTNGVRVLDAIAPDILPVMCAFHTKPPALLRVVLWAYIMRTHDF